MTNATATAAGTVYTIVGEFAGTPVVLDRADRWSDLDWERAPREYATFAQAEARARRLMNGGTRATAIRIIGQ